MKYLSILLLFLCGCATATPREYTCLITWKDRANQDQSGRAWATNAYSARDAESQLRNIFPSTTRIDCE
jgi:hypothetical protein